MGKKRSAHLVVGPWALSVALGFVVLERYERTPGETVVSHGRWPEESSLVRDAARLNVIAFIHPRCPCSRATIDELGWMSDRYGPQIRLTVVAVRPSGVSAEWSRSEVIAKAGAIPGTVVREDDGREARRFGAKTSGQVLVFDRSGALLFSGGVTPARGRAGPSAVRDVVSGVIERAEPVEPGEVFGCALFEEGSPSDAAN
jgi:hypothetical protein